MDAVIIYQIATWVLPILFAITFHEYAHGWVANKLGDNTAKMLGRLTANPIKHIDPIGTILVPALLLLTHSPFLFGYAKPIPVNTRNLKNLRKDMAIIAFAGPLSNLLMAFAWGFIMLLARHGIFGDIAIAKGFYEMGKNGVLINVLLMALNLLPIPPLDGAKVLSGFAPRNIANALDQIEPYGFFILIGLLFLGLLDQIMTPIMIPILKIIYSIFA